MDAGLGWHFLWCLRVCTFDDGSKDISMPRQELQRALGTLHDELAASAQHIEDADRRALLQIMREIEEVLARDEDQGDGAVMPDASLRERMSARIEAFEGSHPRFADLLRRVAESLSNLGI